MKKEYIYYSFPLFFSILFLFTGNLIYILASILISSFIFFKKRKFKVLMLSLFLIYISGILYYTLFSPLYNRNFAVTGLTFEAFINYLKSCNFIPFKTIFSYIKQFFIFSEEITQEVILLNLIGNFICLIPLCIFIPFFFKKFKKRKKFIFLIILLAFIIELLQLITMNGSFDVDDIILNSTGCILFYLLFYTEINRFYDSFIIANNVKEIIIFSFKILLVITISLIIAILFGVRSVKEKKYWDDYHFEELELINYPEVCTMKDKNFIYEDNLFKYYINCSSPKDILISINNNNFGLMDYLEGKTKYPILIHMLESAGMKIEKEDKYEKLVVCPKEISSPNYRADDYSVVDIVQTEDVIQNSRVCKAFYIIPLAEGNSELTIEFDNEKITYHATIDKNKNLDIQLNE